MKALFALLLLLISLLPVKVIAAEAVKLETLPPSKATVLIKPPLATSSATSPTSQNAVPAKASVPLRKTSPVAEALIPPASQQLLPAPSLQSFQELYSRAGKYGLKLPKYFGDNPLAELKPLEDLAIVHAQRNNLFAINLIDHSDTLHYRPTQPLPDFPEAKVVLCWQQPTVTGQSWNCQLLHQQDFNGSYKIIKATTKISGLSYEILYMQPSKDFLKSLPELLYSLHSFKS